MKGRQGEGCGTAVQVAWGPGLPCPTLAVTRQIWSRTVTRPLWRSDLSRVTVSWLIN